MPGARSMPSISNPSDHPPSSRESPVSTRTWSVTDPRRLWSCHIASVTVAAPLRIYPSLSTCMTLGSPTHGAVLATSGSSGTQKLPSRIVPAPQRSAIVPGSPLAGPMHAPSDSMVPAPQRRGGGPEVRQPLRPAAISRQPRGRVATTLLSVIRASASESQVGGSYPCPCPSIAEAVALGGPRPTAPCANAARHPQRHRRSIGQCGEAKDAADQPVPDRSTATPASTTIREPHPV